MPVNERLVSSILCLIILCALSPNLMSCVFLSCVLCLLILCLLPIITTLFSISADFYIFMGNYGEDPDLTG
jgi:hypothetical protein